METSDTPPMKSRSSGFTHFDVFLVIAIVAILAVVLFPIFAKAKMAPTASADMNNLKQLGTAVQMYVGDYDGNYPLENFDSGFSGDLHMGGDIYYRWSSRAVLQSYIKTLAIFKSPIETATVSGVPASYYTKTGVAASRVGTNSYIANSMGFDAQKSAIEPNETAPTNQVGLFGDGGLRDCGRNEQPACRSTRSSQVSYPSELIALGDGATDTLRLLGQVDSTYLNTSNTEFVINLHEDIYDPLFGLNTISDGAYEGYKPVGALREFSGGANYVMADSHAKNLKPGQVSEGDSAGGEGQIFLNQHAWLVSPGN